MVRMRRVRGQRGWYGNAGGVHPSSTGACMGWVMDGRVAPSESTTVLWGRARTFSALLKRFGRSSVGSAGSEVAVARFPVVIGPEQCLSAGSRRT